MFHVSKFQLSKFIQSIVLCLSANTAVASSQDQHEISDIPVQKESEQQLVVASNNQYAFKSQSLFGANRDIDLSVFNVENYIPPDEYHVSMSVNQKEIGDLSVQFDHLDASSSAVLCLDEKLLNRLDLKPQVRHGLEKKSCLTIKELNPDAYYDFNLQKLKLDISIPLVDMVQRPEGYISPELFDDGVSSAFVGYNTNLHHYDNQSTQYLSLNAGLNFAGWYFRHNGYFQTNRSGDLSRYQSRINTLYRDIDQIHSRLSLGEFYSNHQGESLALLGGQLASDDNMLPWSLRNYAPVVQGVANTNALVRVFQNGQKIYEKSVPAGAFELTDLATLSNGDLSVEIIENGGETRTFKMPMQVNIDLIKKGHLKYSTAVGRFKLAEKVTDDLVGQASLSYGVSNNLSLSSAVTLADAYKNLLVSAAVNTYVGGISLATEYSDSTWNDQSKNGQRYQLKYNYFWEPERLNIHFNTTHQTRSYQTANNALSLANYDQLNDHEYQNFWVNNDLKNQHTLSVSKSFQNARWGAVQGSVLRNQYWSDNEDYNQYTFSYSNRWKRINYSVGMTYSKDQFSHQKDNSYYASLSIPLDWKKNNLYLNSNVQHNDNYARSSNANVNLSGTLGQDNQLNFAVGVSQNDNIHEDYTAYNANLNYLHPLVNLGAMAYYDQNGGQYSMSARGAVVAHRYGITATNNIPDTFTIVHIDQGYNAGIRNAWGVRVDRFGNAIYSNSSPYSKNLIQIDPAQMPVSMSINSNQSTIIPRQYSSTLAHFNAQHSSMYVLRVTSEHGSFPMGSEIRNAEQQLIGRLGQSNQAILDQFNPERDRQLSLHWGSKQQQQCQMQLPHVIENKKQTFQIIQAECK